jgi:hypothetical protein
VHKTTRDRMVPFGRAASEVVFDGALPNGLTKQLLHRSASSPSSLERFSRGGAAKPQFPPLPRQLRPPFPLCPRGRGPRAWQRKPLARCKQVEGKIEARCNWDGRGRRCGAERPPELHGGAKRGGGEVRWGRGRARGRAGQRLR